MARCYLPDMFLPPLPPTFDAALRDASSSTDRFRAAAAERLGDCPPGREEEARAALRHLADDRLGPIRELAIDSLAKVGTEADLEFIRARFDDPHVAVRQAAARTAADLDPNPGWLEDLLADERPEMRFQAIRGLGERQPEVAALRLPALLDDPEPQVARAAALTLGDLGVHDATDALAQSLSRPEVAQAAALALASLGDGRGEPILIAGLRDRGFVLEAVMALGNVASERGRAALAALAAGFFTPLLVRAAAGKALAQLGDRRGEEALGAVLRAWRADGRDYAVSAVGELRLTRLVPAITPLARRLRGTDPKVLADALQRLATIDAHAQRALVELRRRFGDPDPPPRGASA